MENNIDIINKILNKNHNFFITWKAGTWKSTLIRYLIDYFDKNNINNVVLAPTWVASINVWWETIHKFFWFPKNIIPQKASELWKLAYDTKEIYKKIFIMIIDEISMVRADLLDCIDIYLRKSRNKDIAFWWVKMIFVWDLYQLPPIINKSETEFYKKYDSSYFFSSIVFSRIGSDLEVINLKNIYRQTDEKFKTVLDNIRIWKQTINDINYLNQAKNHNFTDKHIILTTTNREKDSINIYKLKELKWDLFTSVIEKYWKVDYEETTLPEYLEIKKWARIMFLKNAPDKTYVNGTLWTIKNIDWWTIEIITDNWIDIIITKKDWEEVLFEYVYDNILWKIKKRIRWYFLQYPIVLAWAMTIHKSQWMTYDNISVLFWRWCFADWQAYVALSRATSFNWLHFKDSLNPWSIKVNKKINDFFDNRINNQNMLDFSNIWIKNDDWRMNTIFKNKWWLSYFEVAKSIIEKINLEGWKAFIVGWFCRNRILGMIDQTDIDISTDFIPENIEKYFNVVNKIWEKFWVLVIKEFWYIYEISTFRKDIDKNNVMFIKKFSEDANRRDFTINAIYLDPITDKYKVFNSKWWDNKDILQDWRIDLQKKIIRFIWNPESRIKEDPLRLLRYVRFKTLLNLNDVDDKQYNIVKQNFYLLKEVPFERIKAELEKIFSSNWTIKALEMLKELWFFKIFIPEIDNLEKCPWWPKYHLEWNVWIHTLKIIEVLKKQMVVNPNMYWTALFHDTWKLETYKKRDDNTVTYILHENLSTQIFEKYTKKLKFTKEQIKIISWIIKNHLLFWRILEMKPLKARKLFINDYWNYFFIFCNADNLWREPIQDKIWEKIQKMYEEFMSKYDENLLYKWKDILEKYPNLKWRDITLKLEELNNEIIAKI